MFFGSIPALVTPFSGGRVAEDTFADFIEWQITEGSNALLPCGTTGECATLNRDEHREVIAHVVAVAKGRVPVIAGCGSYSTEAAIEMVRASADVGADAVLVVVPYYNKPNRAGIRAHFEAVAEAVPELPMVMYNIPSRVIVNADPELLAELGRDVPNIVAVKQSNADELGPIDGLAVLAGDNETFCDTLEFGGAGGVLVASNVASRRMREIWDAAQAGDLARARAIDNELRPLYTALGVTTNPIPVKAALDILGLASDRVRLPLVKCDDEQRAAVRAGLEAVGLPVAH